MTPATLTTADFLAAFPIFANATAAEVSAAVAKGNRKCDADAFDTGTSGVANDAAGYWAAYLLALGKFGKDAGLDPKPYRDAYDSYVNGIVAGPFLPSTDDSEDE